MWVNMNDHKLMQIQCSTLSINNKITLVVALIFVEELLCAPVCSCVHLVCYCAQLVCAWSDPKEPLCAAMNTWRTHRAPQRAPMCSKEHLGVHLVHHKRALCARDLAQKSSRFALLKHLLLHRA